MKSNIILCEPGTDDMTVRERGSAFQMRGSKLTRSVPKLEAFPHREAIIWSWETWDPGIFASNRMAAETTERLGVGRICQSAIAHMHPAMTCFCPSGDQWGGGNWNARFWSFQTQDHDAPPFLDGESIRCGWRTGFARWRRVSHDLFIGDTTRRTEASKAFVQCLGSDLQMVTVVLWKCSSLICLDFRYLFGVVL